MKFYEKDLEDLIWDQLDTKEGVDKLYRHGLTIIKEHYNLESPIYIRQMNLGAYGVPDLVAMNVYNQEVDSTVIELKAIPCEIDHIVQICRYKKGIIHWLSESLDVSDVFVEGLIIAKSYEELGDAVFITNELDNITVMEYNFSLEDGINFEIVPRDWSKKPPNFHNDIKCAGYIGNKIAINDEGKGVEYE